MSENALISLASIAATLLASLGVCVFTYLTQRDIKRLAQLEKREKELCDEVNARIALEECACEWLAELLPPAASGKPVSARSTQLRLRDRTEKSSGLRPKISKSKVTN
jgi:hypothetical protein